jgi:hypothetical protein
MEASPGVSQTLPCSCELFTRNTVPLTLHWEKMEASPVVSQTLRCSFHYLLAILSTNFHREKMEASPGVSQTLPCM